MSRLESLASLVSQCLLWGEAGKPFLVEGFKAGCNVVFAWQAWHFVTSIMFHDVSKVVLCGRRKTCARFSENTMHFSWQAQHFGDHRCHFCFARAAHSTCRVAYVLRIAIMSGLRDLVTLAAPHSTLYTPPLHSTLYTVHSTISIPHFTLYTLHSTLSTLHSTLHIFHFTLQSLHITLHT